MPFSLTGLLVGRPLSNREEAGHKLGVLTGIPAVGLDALGSAAYGPEAALSILVAAGTAGVAHLGPVIWIILVLLAVLCFSYWQTIAAYPTNGGSYVVAKENLGIAPSLLAAAALMLDYLLNVAVAISAGVAVLASAAPFLHPYTLWLCLGILAAMTVINLRGTRESGMIWSVPTYLFAATLGLVLVWGSIKLPLYGGHAAAVAVPPPIPRAVEPVTLWLLLRAFASGCTAMTGVEAVSNSVNAFREPKVGYAHGTLVAIVGILGLLLIGVAHLVPTYHIAAMDQTRAGYQTVLSQLTGAVFGRGWFYYIAMGSMLAVLCLSANTSFVGFPRLCHLLAEDGFLPRPFAVPGRRLVYSVGILFLAAGAAGLLVAFGGITDRLIPLFAIGAFLAFTLSQAGMATHWWKHGGSAAEAQTGTRWSGEAARRAKLAINGTGAVATGIALAIILVAKLTAGAWVTLVIIPATILLLRAVRRYYDDIDRQVLRGSRRHIDLRRHDEPLAFVPIKRWDRLARKAVEYAMRISPSVTAVHVVALEGPEGREPDDKLRQEWRDYVEQPATRLGLNPPRLQVVPSEFRSMAAPLLRAIEEAQRQCPGHPVTIILPELVDGRWWGYLMHANRERRLRAQLLRDGGQNVTVATVPWHLRPPRPDQAIADAEPDAAKRSAGDADAPAG
ncbi:MAG TPA: APC family permease [Stellaceae bacterium]|nr:APC family permease [Stellaceae bacterium]